MALQDLESFLAKVEQNPDLQEQLSQLDLQGVLQLAAKEGFQLRAADLLRAQAEQILAMSDDDLDLLVEGGLDDLFDMQDFQAYLDRGETERARSVLEALRRVLFDVDVRASVAPTVDEQVTIEETLEELTQLASETAGAE